MKGLIVTTCLCIIGTTSISWGQIDTTRKEFFPLHLGDIWQYRNEFGTISGTAQVVRVDTLLANGYRYAATATPPEYSTGYGFVRLDSLLKVQSYGGWGGDSCGGTTPNDISTYRLSETVGTVWHDCLNFGGYLTRKTIIKYNGLTQIFAFGQSRQALVFRFGGVFPSPIDTFYGSQGIIVKGLGLFRQEYYESMGFEYLTGAVINGTTYGTIVGVKEVSSTYPQKTRLFQNFPNPFNPSTSIRYELPSLTSVKLLVFDILGRAIATLVDERQDPGSYEVSFSGSAISSGVYFYRLYLDDHTIARKMILQK